ncbi:hypothetical protein CAMRE0001_1083 [Campylobacter rectus RM3267]|uniref:Uncharacterized protein n=2 Tax=Campylobacter rectus TaxID=203 RepID=A0A6G5QMA1_CAMRE|nr:hypothetical protein [Campylobacter rectus]EEF12581.1 hypothetical protein CAMRE0001_1083 [Campylobacter rectus RM3267]QCD46800.1 hypothetical protein CRECT_1140 [Campylobacter rectus]UEB47505.1 hypothetical protein LK437_10990 [Campylobacter rectus]
MKFYKSLKFKILAAVLLLITILCAVFIRIIPDYSTSRGFAIVSLPDYNKYKQGYCLKENRILPKEELYKRAIGQFLDYKLKLERMINDYRTYAYGSSRRSAYEIAYYELENINLSNWFEVLQKYYKKGKTTEEILMKELKAKKTDPKKYLKISSDGAGFGFDRPIVLIGGSDKAVTADLLLDKFVLINKNYLRYNHSEYLHDRAEIDVITKKHYEDRSKVILFDTKKEGTEFDNCGNLNYPLEEYYLRSREAKGG